MMGDYPDEFAAWYSDYDDVIEWPAGQYPNYVRQYHTPDHADSGADGTVGTKGQNGDFGASGDGALAVLNVAGSSLAEFGDSLVYLYDMGQGSPGGALSFNIIRVGDTTSAQSVDWSIVGHGANGVTGADFVGGVLPSGTVTFDPITEIPDHDLGAGLDYDRTANVRKVTLELAANRDDLPEGYQIVLTSGAGSSLLLGTSTATGTVTDGDGGGDDDNAPVITSNGGGAAANVSVAENTTAVTTVAATDKDGNTLTYTIKAGGDGALFKLNSATHALSFKSAPDFEAPADANKDNVYDVAVQVSDGTHVDTQVLHVSVTDVAGVTIVGSKKNDKIDATHTPSGQPLPTNEEDTISGGNKNDTIFGLAGNDTLSGGNVQIQEGQAEGHQQADWRRWRRRLQVRYQAEEVEDQGDGLRQRRGRQGAFGEIDIP